MVMPSVRVWVCVICMYICKLGFCPYLCCLVRVSPCTSDNVGYCAQSAGASGLFGVCLGSLMLMLYGAGNEGKTVVYNHFLDEKDKNNAKHIAREVHEFLTASHMTNVVAGMFALCCAFAHISAAATLALQACTVPLCDAAAAASAPDKFT